MPSHQAQIVVHKVVGALKVRRESLGWSQRRLASQAGVDPKTVNLIERGIRSPTLFTLSLVAMAMNVPLWSILREVETKEVDKS